MSGFAMRRPLGKTGLQVSPLGIGGGNGIASKDILYAFEQGINYFFFSSDLHHFRYQRSVEALRTLCGQGSSIRDKVVLATVSYVNNPNKIRAILFDQLSELHIDYIDVFHWGWITNAEASPSLLHSLTQLKEGETLARIHRQAQMMHEQAEDINKEMVRSGLVRSIGASFHSLRAARTWMSNLDVLMLRYNLSHTDVEREIFPLLPVQKELSPGIVVFNTSHDKEHSFHIAPPGFPSNIPVPSVPDCYRFALSNPQVDTVLAGFTKREQIDLALTALEQGPCSQHELALLREYGAIHADITNTLQLQALFK